MYRKESLRRLVCMQAEARRFLGALAKRCQLSGSALVSTAQLFALADDLELAVPNMSDLIAELNDAGALGEAQSLHTFCEARVRGRVPAMQDVYYMWSKRQQQQTYLLTAGLK